MPNRLAGETSPYLLQHAGNPVDWYPWGDEAFAHARAEDKPILLSIGYSACHWCHVMAHESFEDEAVAALMNDLFVNIKVDREERPDIDQIYQMAQAMLTHRSGGWPLTMFLTPDQAPFFGGTYFPKTPRYGLDGFAQLLPRIAAAYREQGEAIAEQTGRLKAALALTNPEAQHPDAALPVAASERALAALARSFDPVHGGFGAAPKFPHPFDLEFCLRRYAGHGDSSALKIVTVTLERMADGGIQDQIGGGFCRYSVDAEWTIPHFEKMLYDNAALLSVYADAWRATGKATFGRAARGIVAWALRDMRAGEGAFCSSLDADSEHEEGKFYVWSEAEIDAVLGAPAALFKRFYDVDAQGNWEEHTILNRLKMPVLADPETERELAHCRTLLLRAREGRVRPGLDDKVLADWNGLMIAAMANAGIVFGRPAWIGLARGAFDFIRRHMVGPDQRLLHSWRAGRARHPASVDDYANLCRAALTLNEATGDEDFLVQARNWMTILDHHYWDSEDGGYFFAAKDTEGLVARPKTAADSAVPAGNGTLVGVLSRLAMLTGEEAYRRRAEAILTTFSGEVARNFFPLATLLNNVELLTKPLQIVLVGKRGDPAFDALCRTVYSVSLPNRVVLSLPPGRELPSDHPAHGKGLVDGRAAAYVCNGPTCSLPLTEPQALIDSLAALR